MEQATGKLHNFKLGTRYIRTNGGLFVVNEKYAMLYKDRQGELWHAFYTPRKTKSK